jgi:hypothetical protein
MHILCALIFFLVFGPGFALVGFLVCDPRSTTRRENPTRNSDRGKSCGYDGGNVKTLIFCALALCAASLSGQSLPDAPKPHLDRAEWSLLAVDAAARGLDVYSTHWAEQAGNKERVLPGFIANHPPVMVLYSGGMVAAQYWIARKLFAHHHRKLAYVMTTADVAITAPSAIHNLFLPVCVAPNVYLSTGCQAPVSGVTYR